MKKICIFTNTLCSGGAEKQAVLLAKVLNKNYNIWLVVYYGKKVEQKFLNTIKDNNIKVLFLSGFHYSRCISFYSFLKKESIEIIFSYLLTTNFLGGIISKIAGVKYTIGGIRSSKLEKKKIMIQKILQNYVNNHTIYNNNKGYEELSKKGFNSKKAVVIPNCFELANDLLMRKRKKQITILSVGRFHKAKDYETAIKAVSILRKRNKNLKYQIIGFGAEEENIYKWVNEYQASCYINLIINPPNLMEYYRNADIYLMTSIFEGLSNTVMEAMSFSLPLIITNVGDNDRLVINGENGYLCEPGNSIQIAAYLLDLCNSYEKRILFGKKSYNILKENYSYEKFQNNYFEFINKLEEVK